MSFTANITDTYSPTDREPAELARGEGRRGKSAAFRDHLWCVPDSPIAPIAGNQIGHELNLAFTDLGGAAFALAHQGALNDKRLAPRVSRICELFAQLDAANYGALIQQTNHGGAAK
jgi:hypothetical protein